MSTIGILAIQGDARENHDMTREAARPHGISVRYVKTPQEIARIDALVIGGGESTTIGDMMLVGGALGEIKRKAESGMPVFGICAGLVLLSSKPQDRTVGETGQTTLGLLDVAVERNSYGSQRNSFESPLKLDAITKSDYPGVFIRAPSVISAGSGVKILARHDGRPVAVRSGNILGTTFHPELTRDIAFHRYFVDMVRSSN